MITYIKNALGIGKEPPKLEIGPPVAVPAKGVEAGTLCRRCVLPHAPPDIWLDNDDICEFRVEKTEEATPAEIQATEPEATEVTEQGRTERDGTKQNKREQNITEQNRTEI